MVFDYAIYYPTRLTVFALPRYAYVVIYGDCGEPSVDLDVVVDLDVAI